jgi:hypothetical protein
LPKQKLQEVLMQFYRLKEMEERQGKDLQADAFLNSNLSANQMGLVQEMIRIFEINSQVKQMEAIHKLNAPKDSLDKGPDSNLQNQKPKPDSPKKDSPPKAKP